MSKDFVEQGDADFADQLKAHALGLDNEGAALGFTIAQIAAAHADADFWEWLVLEQEIVQHYGQDFSKYKELARKGRGSEVLGPVPSAPVYGTIPTLVAEKIEERFRQRAAKAKAVAGVYNQGIGEILRIVATSAPFDPNVGMPVFRVIFVSGHPDLFFRKGKWQAVEIWKDSGDGQGWKKKDRWTSSPWADPDPLPAAGQSAVWKYKMVYVYKNQTVASWSAEVTVTVYGPV